MLVDPADNTREWSARLAAVFDRAAASYENVGVPWFTPLARRLVDEIGPQPGERALDIGCGRGAALFPLADAVGPTGRVTGIDLAPGMVAATGAEARERGLTNVELHVMDASAPSLPKSSMTCWSRRSSSSSCPSRPALCKPGDGYWFPAAGWASPPSARGTRVG